MKTEASSFTPTSGACTIVLDDDTMNVKGIYFQVRKNGSNVNEGTGFSDSVKNRGGYVLDDTVKDTARSTTYSVFNNKLSGGVSTTANRGKVNANGFSVTGEVDMTFDNADTSYTVDYFAIGD